MNKERIEWNSMNEDKEAKDKTQNGEESGKSKRINRKRRK